MLEEVTCHQPLMCPPPMHAPHPRKHTGIFTPHTQSQNKKLKIDQTVKGGMAHVQAEGPRDLLDGKYSGTFCPSSGRRWRRSVGRAAAVRKERPSGHPYMMLLQINLCHMSLRCSSMYETNIKIKALTNVRETRLTRISSVHRLAHPNSGTPVLMHKIG